MKLAVILALGLAACVAVAAPPKTMKTAPTDVEVCQGVWADPTGARPASAALQKCLDSKTRSRKIELPRGTYRIDKMLLAKHSGTVLTTRGLFDSDESCGDGDAKCAVLKAAPSLEDQAILQVPGEVANLTLDHVNFDGNRPQRLTNATAMAKAAKGRNVFVIRGDGIKIRGCGFYRAVCGTALAMAVGERPARNVSVTRCVFADNGVNAEKGLWADGFTLGYVTDSDISDNEFRDNSDVSLILGGGTNTQIRRNVFRQTWQRVFAAFMLTNWSSLGEARLQKWADFRGLVFEDNVLELGEMADIGLQIGTTTWAGSDRLTYIRTQGGTFARNTISTARQGINVAGAGTWSAPVVLQNNTVNIVGEPKPGGFSRTVPSSALNIQKPGHDSFVVGDTQGATDTDWDRAF